MQRRPSVMAHQFSQVPAAQIERSKFDRSHGYKTTFNSGLLVPVFFDEALPGDTFSLNMNGFARLATPLHPFMDNLFLDVHFWYVPLRILWSNFKKFMGEQVNPGDSTSFLIPTITSPAGGYSELSLYDYFGLPVKAQGITHSAMWLRAYNLIWNEWYRDQNLQNSLTVPLTDGPDSDTLYTVQRRGKRHDYFTSCLPFPQKGPAVMLPLGTSANVRGIGVVDADPASADFTHRESTGVVAAGANIWSTTGTPQTFRITQKTLGGTKVPDIWADLSTATAATINQLRQAFQIQRIYERDARGGTRYTELVQAHFGVTSPDARLQRPEFLGGGTVPINVNPIAQTAPQQAAGVTTPQGNLAAMGTAHVHGIGFSKSFTEHGVVIGLVSVRADLNYQQGLDRMWSRSTRFDFYWPALAHIGEQAVLNQEIYAVGIANPAQDAATFGYQERYAEYRYKPSKITGRFRSNAAVPLDTWHLAQSFGALPVLNAAFIVEQPPISRVIAVPSEPEFLLDCYYKYVCARPMPVYSVPGMIDHF